MEQLPILTLACCPAPFLGCALQARTPGRWQLMHWVKPARLTAHAGQSSIKCMVMRALGSCRWDLHAVECGQPGGCDSGKLACWHAHEQCTVGGPPAGAGEYGPLHTHGIAGCWTGMAQVQSAAAMDCLLPRVAGLRRAPTACCLEAAALQLQGAAAHRVVGGFKKKIGGCVCPPLGL